MIFNTRQAFLVALTMLTLIATASVNAGEFNIIKPEKVGVSSERLEYLNKLSKEYVSSGKYSGIVTMVARRGKIIHLNAQGHYGVNNTKPLTPDTLFRIYSMTKPITALAAMILFEEGKFHMTDPVSKHLPEFKEQKILLKGKLVAPQSPMLMRQLFTHTAGLSYGATQDNAVDRQYAQSKLLQSKDMSEFITKLAALPLRFEPGTRYHYSVSLDVLGAVIERLSGQSLDEFFDQRIFKPLAMNDTFFEVPVEKAHRLASDQYWDYENNRLADVPEGTARKFDNVTMFFGGGGLVSTVADYMRFCQMILNGGSLDGKRIVGPKTIEFYSSNHLSKEVWNTGRGQYPGADLYPGQSMALGQGVVIEPGVMPSMSSLGELSWGGIAGTKYWIDPKEQLIGIAMVQQYRSPWPLRFDMKASVYQALTELN